MTDCLLLIDYYLEHVEMYFITYNPQSTTSRILSNNIKRNIRNKSKICSYSFVFVLSSSEYRDLV